MLVSGVGTPPLSITIFLYILMVTQVTNLMIVNRFWVIYIHKKMEDNITHEYIPLSLYQI